MPTIRIPGTSPVLQSTGANASRPLYIFDLDGTLALIEHRRHFVENRANRWKEFHAACVDDKPNAPVIEILRTLSQGPEAAEIWIFSGRSDEVLAETEAWLLKHVRSEPFVLLMREKGDFTPDDVLKRMWYEAMLDEDKARLVAVFDDRTRVVNMWRELGVTCLQVAPGDF